MKKKLNQKLINLIEYYNLINANFFLSNKPLKRTIKNETFSPVGTKEEKLNKLKKKIQLIQNCELKAIKRNGDSIEGIETTKGFIKTKKVGVVAAGHSSVIANMVDLKLPLESKPLQALVSEPVKPIIDTVVMSMLFMLM